MTIEIIINHFSSTAVLPSGESDGNKLTMGCSKASHVMMIFGNKKSSLIVMYSQNLQQQCDPLEKLGQK